MVNIYDILRNFGENGTILKIVINTGTDALELKGTIDGMGDDYIEFLDYDNGMVGLIIPIQNIIFFYVVERKGSESNE